MPSARKPQEETELMTLYEELKARGLIAQVTDEEEITRPDQQRQGHLLHRL